MFSNFRLPLGIYLSARNEVSTREEGCNLMNNLKECEKFLGIKLIDYLEGCV